MKKYFCYYIENTKEGGNLIKLIATDMDGTLLNENGIIPKEFFHIFKDLIEKNVLFASASGRQYYNLVKNFESIKDDMLFIAENGTYVMYKGEELYSNFLDINKVQELIKLGRQTEGCSIVLCGKCAAYVESDDSAFISEVAKYYERYQIVEDISTVSDDILKFTLCDFKGAANNSNKIFYPLYGETLQVTVSGQIWLDIVNKAVNKGLAIRSIQKKFNISPEETLVFGDYFNDIEMLQSAYHSYAMENAPAEVKKHARFIAESNRNNGVLKTIKELIYK